MLASESVAHSAFGFMGYWLSAHSGSRNYKVHKNLGPKRGRFPLYSYMRLQTVGFASGNNVAQFLSACTGKWTRGNVRTVARKRKEDQRLPLRATFHTFVRQERKSFSLAYAGKN